MTEDLLPFGAAANRYDRPPPQQDALRWLTSGDFHDVLDLAAGTGLVTRELLDLNRFQTITAVEPDPRMRRRLTSTIPEDVRTIDGAAERIPLDDASIDAVIVGDAWQWFDPAVAELEIARVLRPGGVLGVFWNLMDDSVDWMRHLHEELLPSREWSHNRPGVFSPLSDNAFGPLSQWEKRWYWTVAPSRFVASLCTYSTVLALAPDDRGKLTDRVTAFVRGLSPNSEMVNVPVRTIAYRTARRSSP